MTDLEAADAWHDNMHPEQPDDLDPVADGEVSGWCDATNNLPSQAADRFCEIWHRFDGSAWPAFRDAYSDAYEQRRKEMARVA